MEYNPTTMCGNLASIYLNLMAYKEPDWLTPEMGQYLLDDMMKINRTAEKIFFENCQANSAFLMFHTFSLMGVLCLSVGSLVDSALEANRGRYKEAAKTAALALTFMVPTLFVLQTDPCSDLTYFMGPMFQEQI